jgi:F-type H+-transporting ATPase subunit delta
MTLTAVAKRYADALADVVTAQGSALRPEDAVAELRSFESALEGSAELRTALVSPAVPAGRKKAVVGRIAEALALSRVTRNFLFVLVDHRRIASLREILHLFELTIDERLGFARAEITSAGELTESQRTALDAELRKLTGSRVRMRFTVDPSLIGGVTAKIGSTVYDGSVRGHLQSLARRLEARV